MDGSDGCRGSAAVHRIAQIPGCFVTAMSDMDKFDFKNGVVRDKDAQRT